MMLFALLLASCHGRNADTPKPQAYLRIDLPAHAYTQVDTSALPFSFDRSSISEVQWKKNTATDKWFTLAYPKYKGYVFLTYKSLRGLNDLRAQIDTSYQFVEGHFSFSSGIDENKFMDRSNRLYGRFAEGNVVEVCESPAEFTIRSTKPGTVTINNFTYPLRLSATVPSNVGTFVDAVLRTSTSNIEELRSQVEDNLFTREFGSYRTLGREVRRYQGKMDSVTRSR